MAEPILVAYATKHGSTKEVAERIALTLRLRGHAAEERPAAEVKDVSVYGAVVLGGSLYMGRWHEDARRFLMRHRQALAELPVAIFALGPRTLEEADVAQSRAQLEHALASEPTIHPVLVEIFGGVVEPTRLQIPVQPHGAVGREGLGRDPHLRRRDRRGTRHAREGACPPLSARYRPRRSSCRSSRRQRGRTLTTSSRKTRLPSSASTSGRARVPISFTI
jgi:menaquinone-dependent protoporphyrinogen oxidase